MPHNYFNFRLAPEGDWCILNGTKITAGPIDEAPGIHLTVGNFAGTISRQGFLPYGQSTQVSGFFIASRRIWWNEELRSALGLPRHKKARIVLRHQYIAKSDAKTLAQMVLFAVQQYHMAPDLTREKTLEAAIPVVERFIDSRKGEAATIAAQVLQHLKDENVAPNTFQLISQLADPEPSAEGSFSPGQYGPLKRSIAFAACTM